MSKYHAFIEKLERMEQLIKKDDLWEVEEELDDIMRSVEYHLVDLEIAACKEDRAAEKLLDRFNKVEKAFESFRKSSMDSIFDMMYPDQDEYDENDPMDEQWLNDN